MRHHKLDSFPTVAADYDRELHSLLNQAIDLPREQMRPFLERTASSPELAFEVEGLLLEHMNETSGVDFLRPPMPGIVSWTARIAA